MSYSTVTIDSYIHVYGFRQEGYSLVNNSSSTVETLEYAHKYRNVEGMSWIVTCLFIVGETAGGGLIALPAAMTSAG